MSFNQSCRSFGLEGEDNLTLWADCNSEGGSRRSTLDLNSCINTVNENRYRGLCPHGGPYRYYRSIRQHLHGRDMKGNIGARNVRLEGTVLKVEFHDYQSSWGGLFLTSRWTNHEIDLAKFVRNKDGKLEFVCKKEPEPDDDLEMWAATQEQASGFKRFVLKELPTMGGLMGEDFATRYNKRRQEEEEFRKLTYVEGENVVFRGT